MTDEQANAPALVVLVNNRGDWERVTREHWYRIPLKRAPQRVAASFLAFYHTRAFGDDAFHVRFYAPVERYHLLTRREILPMEPEHPRAGERYYRIELGSVEELPRAIPSRRLRRITFIPTTLHRLQTAQEINDLWLGDGVEEMLWDLFRDAGIKAERRLTIGEGSHCYVAPFAIPSRRGGGVAIFCDAGQRPGRVGGWHCLTFAPSLIHAMPDKCIEVVTALLARLDGGPAA